MKKLLSLLLCALLCASFAASAEPSCNRIGLEALTDLWDGKSNCFVSPVSLGLALELANAGARGQTREEIDALLRDTDLHAFSIPGIRAADAAFFRNDALIKDSYRQALADYGAAIFPLDDAGRVNDWVRERTDGLIEKLIDDLSSDTLFVLVNALAMDARWEQPFEAAFTRPQVFRAPDGDVEVSMMHNTVCTDYAELDGQQVLKLYYEDCGLYMLLALPEDGDVNGTLRWIRGTELDQIPFALESAERIVSDIIENERRYGHEPDEDELQMIREWFGRPMPWNVVLSLPKFDISAGCELSGVLRTQGMKAAFDETQADFSGISDVPLCISGILQRVRVQVDEVGTRAAAATAELFDTTAAMYEQIPVQFCCDRPFVMLIADEDSGAICFAGIVMNPTSRKTDEQP